MCVGYGCVGLLSNKQPLYGQKTSEPPSAPPPQLVYTLGIFQINSHRKEMASKFVADAIEKNNVLVFSKATCPYCKMAKECLSQVGAKFVAIEIGSRG